MTKKEINQIRSPTSDHMGHHVKSMRTQVDEFICWFNGDSTTAENPTWHVESGVLVRVRGRRRGQRDGDAATDDAPGGGRCCGGGGRGHGARRDGLR